jgi:8-oxo-dGTP pyrophosphatase MutT (NUDIX family)
MKRRLANLIRRSSLLRWGLRLGVQLFIPRQHVGVVGALFNEAGQVLLVEHVFRPYFPWGLPGGWIGRGEDPALAVEREYQEELGMQIQVGSLLLCQPQGGRFGVPPGLGLAYYCRLKNEESANVALADTSFGQDAYELLAAKWIEPEKIEWTLTPIDRRAIELGQQVFARERQNKARKD